MFPQGLYNMLGMPDFKSDDDGFDNRAEIHEIFAWWPKQCWITHQWMWLTYVVMGTAVWTGPGTPVVEKRYYNPVQYTMEKLKGTTQ
jgi:hypothetical protein